ncbi:MAG: DNA mismatch repair endonuclease MutL [Bacteroidales bacterium]|nr:DNA mismatch repair endonuclease MutL [Bacteroidales bacterium]
MSDIINLLPDSVANQIAAGEVVDRPASAVKELLENAIDAGATAIQLIIRDAGRTLLQVIDNGCGMSDSDARLCFERHATSKIHSADDLFALHTMGFRGEALASIAAVGQVELRTRQADNDLGTSVIIEGSDVKSQEPCTCAVGTSIAVKNLFYNIPARREFLKKDSIEYSHIEDIFKRVAIVNHHVAFTLHHNGKLLYDLHPGNKAQRIASLFGGNPSERLYPVKEDTSVVSVEGFVGKPEFARKARGEQYIFVNNRFIKHPALSAAVEKAYTDLIPDRSYPSYFLFIQVDPSRIDVNIHPTKTEVRFVDEHALFAIVRAATKKAIGQFSLANEINFDAPTDIDFDAPGSTPFPTQPKVNYDPDYNPFHTPTHRSSSAVSNRFDSFFDTVGNHSSTPTQTELTAVPAPPPRPSAAPTPTPLSFNDRYIITALKSGIVIIDQQRAHERILFDEFMLRKETSVPAGAQQLLFPINCTFSPADAELIREMLDDLRRIGFAIEALGNTTFVISATPPDVKESELQTLFEQMTADYKSSLMQKFSDRDRLVYLSLARQMAVKPGTHLQPEEIQHILAGLFSCQSPDISPSGKRIMHILTEQELTEKLK